MKILTCIKQSVVPDHLQQADMPLSDDSGMNRYDKYALEKLF
ncbi:hypothetical protein QUF76_15210 [Desulfobacterales bacterium HSG16]|nr:hypothetical protein [Desulfobacterales bacterium HSG16]